MAYYPPPVGRLIEALQRLPGIGPKTAQRLTFHLLKQPLEAVRELAEALVDLKARVLHCSRCFNVTDEDPCRICADPARDAGLLCVVEEPNDLLAMERMGEYRGRYHVLLGALSPLDGIGPDELKVRELLTRLESDRAREVARDTEVGGCPYKAGQMVMLSFPAANRDPALFPDADTVLIDRAENRHAAFGLGIHRCLGSNLARMELRIALEEWLRRIPDFTLVDPGAVTWSLGTVRGPRRLPVAFGR